MKTEAMIKSNEVGFDGTVKISPVNYGPVKILFKWAYDMVQLREYRHKQPCNEFVWLKKEKELLYRNKDGKFFRMVFEEIEV